MAMKQSYNDTSVVEINQRDIGNNTLDTKKWSCKGNITKRQYSLRIYRIEYGLPLLTMLVVTSGVICQ